MGLFEFTLPFLFFAFRLNFKVFLEEALRGRFERASSFKTFLPFKELPRSYRKVFPDRSGKSPCCLS